VSKANNLIQVFEYEKLKVDDERGFTKEMFQQMERFRGTGQDFPYYSLGHNCILFNEYVGVIQVGKTSIEVLPKIDRDDRDTSKWQGILLQMLLYTQNVQPQTFQDAQLNLKSNSILELYFDLFLNQCLRLMRQGLIKRYRQVEGNQLALKGALVFGKHIQQNVVHKERFYTRHTIYSKQHLLHQVLFETLQLIRSVSSNSSIGEKVNRVLFDFPEQERLKVSALHFDRIPTNRKTEPYSEALKIARLLLLRFRPDISHGVEEVISLMFDMNSLWEEFVFKSVKQSRISSRTLQEPKFKYWNGEGLGKKLLKPDIYVELENGDRLILETKWKTPHNSKPNDADLRQLLAYSHFYNAKASYLLYPSKEDQKFEGNFASTKYKSGESPSYGDVHGGVIRLNILDGEKLNMEIGEELINSLVKTDSGKYTIND
jgi:5-methylcytosine-specific restriction enzyme subunit McrC